MKRFLIASTLATCVLPNPSWSQTVEAPATPSLEAPATASPVSETPAASPSTAATSEPSVVETPASPTTPAVTSAEVIPEVTPSESTVPQSTTPTIVAPDDTGEQVKSATQSYNSGLAAVKAERWEEAATFFERTVALSPQDATAQMLLGYSYLKQGRNADALQTLSVAQKLSTQLDVKSRAFVQNYMGLAQWNIRDYANALKSYRSALALDKNYSDARYNLAFALLSRRQGREAIGHFNQLIARSPRDAALHDGLGQAYESIGNWTRSAAAYRAAIALAPKEASYALNLGAMLVRSDPTGAVRGRHEAAVAMLKRAVSLDPQEAPAYLQLGLVYLQKKRWSDAQSALRSYVALRPQDFTGQFNLALSLDYAAKLDEALQTYAAAERVQPTDPSVKNNIGRIHLKQGKLEEAVVQFRRALDLDSSFLDARSNLALALAQKGDKAAANSEWRNLVDSAVRIARSLPVPGSKAETFADRSRRREVSARLASARGALAEGSLQSGAYAEAAQQYRELLKLDPNNTPAQINLGLALYNIKDFNGALQTYNSILQREPRSAVAYNNRGVVLEALKNKVAALAAYRRAVELQPSYTDAKNNRDRLLATTVVS
jgi:tetratricopeptide (TPR) repeat protein